MKFEIWCLDSFPFLKMNSIINSCMKFSRYIRVSETISCIFYTSGLIDHAIQESLFLDRIIDKSLISLLKIRQPPIFPGRLQPSIVGRVSLNHRVRDGNGCCPDAHRHRNILLTFARSSAPVLTLKLRFRVQYIRSMQIADPGLQWASSLLPPSALCALLIVGNWTIKQPLLLLP